MQLQHTDIFDTIEENFNGGFPMYCIYHIADVKYGCTNNPERREKQSRRRYGDDISFEVIESYEDIKTASMREIELNKKYVTNDRKPYYDMISMREKVVYPTGKDHHNYGIGLTGDKNPNFGNKWTDEQKANLSKKNTNPKDSTRKKMSEAWNKRKMIFCPNCGKGSINAANMKRWHFDNCKLRPQRLSRRREYTQVSGSDTHLKQVMI